MLNVTFSQKQHRPSMLLTMMPTRLIQQIASHRFNSLNKAI